MLMYRSLCIYSRAVHLQDAPVAVPSAFRSYWTVIARSKATKQSSRSQRLGLLRFARNDGRVSDDRKPL